MRRFTPLLAILAAITLCEFVSAQSVTTDPVGFTSTTSLLGNSDTFVSIPFTRVPEFVGAIASTTTAGTITVVGTPLVASQFKYVAGSQPKHYYVLIGPSASKEGRTYAITDNTNNTLTVTTTTLDDASGIPAGTQITIIPNWTPKTIFPATDAGVSFTATTSPPTYQTLLRVPNASAAGINLPFTEYYFNGGSWQRVSPAGVGDDDALLPDSYFVVRNANGAPTLTLTCLGSVLLKKISTPLLTAASPGQDNPLSVLRPLDVPLDATGLSAAFGANDQLLLFNNTVAGFDKTPSATYTYDTRWRLSGDATSADHGADIIPLGSGFIVRKIGGSSTFWTNSFPVLAVSAVSRKSHGGTIFDVNLPLNTSIGVTNPGIECRAAGSTPAGAGVDHQIVLTFPVAVTFGTPSVTSGAGSVGSSSGSGTTTVTLNLTGITNAQYVTVTIPAVNDGTNVSDVAVRMGVLLADVNGSGRVDAGDVSLVRQQTLATLTTANFREDINVSNRIDAGDVSIARQQTLTSLPPP